MAIYQPWWPGAFVFLLNLFGLANGPIDPRLYILIGSMFIPATATAWFLGVTEMVFKGKRNIIVGFYLILTVLMDIFIVVIIFGVGDYTILGTISVVDADYNIIMIMYYMFVNLSVATTGFLMGKQSLKSRLPQVNLRGKFLIAASICYFLGGLLDVGLIEQIPQLIFVTRAILMSSSVLFYLGFLLPKPLEKFLLKE